MIQLYNKGQTDFTKKGITLNAQKASVTYMDNGRFDLDLTIPAPDNITFDYGQVIRCSVPYQQIPAITLGTVSYYTVSNSEGSTLWSQVPTLKRVYYKQWIGYSSSGGIHVYSVGDKVTYLNKNYRCTYFDGSSPQAAVPPNNNSSWWTQISGTTGTPGKAAASVAYGDVIMKTADFNSEYFEAATTGGKTGYIKIADVTATGDTETRTIPAQTITAQNFTITEIEKSTDGKQFTIHAEHVSYGLGRTILGDCNLVNVNPATAILFIQGAMKETYTGGIYTNLTEESITADWSWKNAQNAILDPKAGLLQFTNGQIIRNDLDVFLISKGTPAAKYTVKYGTNLMAVKWDGSVSQLVTRIYPTAQTADGDTLLLPEEHIDTVRTVPYIRPEVLNTGLKVGLKEKQSDGTEIELTEDIIFTRMREAAANRFNIDECDKTDITLEVDWLHLPDAEEYKQYASLKNAAPGEWVQVTDGPLGISELIQLTGYTFDPILERYEKCTFGKNKVSPGVASYDIQTGAVSGRALAAGAVGSQNIQANSITAREIEAGSITADRIASRSITAEIIAANAITAEAINAGSVTADKIAANSITAEKIAAGAVTAIKIDANAITADKIDTYSIAAINAKLGTATVTNGYIDNAVISYADIKAATAESLFARDAITDKYYIDKLAVNSAQMAYATVGELIVKATDNHYYRLDVDANGAISPTDVTNDLTNAEITAGVTSDGRSAIIETDLTVNDLSASTMKVINALIDKLTAARIDVSELWARNAFINELMVTDISSNTYIQATIGNWASQSTITQTINALDSRISSLGYGTVYMQPEEPDHGELVVGDIWIQTQASGTWEQVYQDYATWQTIYDGVSTWQTLGGVSIMWVWDGRKWQEQLNALDSDTFETEIAQNAHDIQLLAVRTTTVEGDLQNKYTIRSGITIEAAGISISGSQYVKIASGGYFQVQTGNFGIDTDSSTYVIWSGASSAASSPFWVKKSGEIYAVSGTVGGFTLASNSLSSGSGSTYININSNASNTYAIWAGAELAANAPFRLKRDGTVYLTSLIALAEDGTESTVNLRTAGLWKLNYKTVKSATSSGGYCTSMTFSDGTSVNFKSAASVTVSGSWSGNTYTATASNGATAHTTLSYSSGYANYGYTIDSFTSDTHLAGIIITADGGYVGNLAFKIDATSVYTQGINYADSLYHSQGTGTLYYKNPGGEYVSLGYHHWYYK